MKCAISYARVSSERQASEGVSLDMQRQRVAAWCAQNGYELVASYSDEGVSGKSIDNRPELLRALDHACEAKAVLVSYSLSRVARSTSDLLGIVERFTKAGAGMVSLTENLDTTSATGRLIFTILAGFATFERELISERVTAAMGHAKGQGRRLSRYAPVGFRFHEGKVVPDDDAMRAVQFAKSQRQAGAGYATIRERMVEAGYKPWSVGTIRRAVNNA